MSDKQDTLSQHPTQGWTRAPDYRSLFSNQSRVRVGPGEIGLTFSHSEDVPGAGVISSDQVAITISPTHAKRFAIALAEFLKLYEEKFGQILPDPAAPIDFGKAASNVEKSIAAWKL